MLLIITLGQRVDQRPSKANWNLWSSYHNLGIRESTNQPRLSTSGHSLSLELLYSPNCDYTRLLWWLRHKRICLQCRRPEFNPWVGKIPWRRTWQPTRVFLSGESPTTEEHGGLQSMGLQESDTTKHSTAQPDSRRSSEF